MAIRGSFKLTGRIEDAIVNEINSRLGSPKARASFNKVLKPFIAATVADAIGGRDRRGNTNVAKQFQPFKYPDAEYLVGQLGVGTDGAPDEDKLRNAWRLLLPNVTNPSSGKVTRVSASFGKGTRFGRVNISIDVDAFLNDRLTTKGINVDGGLRILHWMQHLIDGTEVHDHEFVGEGDRKFYFVDPDRTRTGLGILVKVPGKTWFLPPQAPDAFDNLFKALERKFNSNQFAREFVEQMLEALDRV